MEGGDVMALGNTLLAFGLAHPSLTAALLQLIVVTCTVLSLTRAVIWWCYQHSTDAWSDRPLVPTMFYTDRYHFFV